MPTTPTTLRIDPDDELPIILERLPAHGACIVVVPPHARVLGSPVGAKLLARRAAGLGTRVAVVTDDRAVAATVRAAGLPVGETVEEAQHLLGMDAAGTTTATEQTVAMPVASDGGPDDAGDIPDVPPGPVTAAGQRGARVARTEGNGAQAGGHVADGEAGEDADWHTSKTIRFVAGDPDTEIDDDARGHGGQSARSANGATGDRADEVDDLDEDDEDDDQEVITAPPATRHNAVDDAASAGVGQPIRGHSGGIKAARGAAGSSQAKPLAGGVASGARARQAAPRSIARLLVSAVLVAVLLGLLWLLVVVLGGLLNPEATVTIAMKPGNVTATTQPIHALQGLSLKRKDATHVPMGRVLWPETASRTLVARGVNILPGNVATGTLQLANATTQQLSLPAGATFTTANGAHAFVSTATVTVPAAKRTFNGAHFGLASVPIRAATGGASGNVPRLAITRSLAYSADVLQVRNEHPTTGGTDVRQRVVAPRDLGPAYGSLLGAMKQQANIEIARKYGADVQIHQFKTVRQRYALDYTPDRKHAKLTLGVTVYADFVHRADLLPAVNDAIGRATQSGPPLIPSSVTWNTDAGWRPDNTIVLTVHARTKTPLDVEALRRAISGKPKDAALAYLHRRPDVAHVELLLEPTWADHLPTDLTRIRIDEQPSR